MEEYMQKILSEFHIHQRYVGYDYMVITARLVSRNPNYLHHISKFIYPEVARICTTNSRCVERNIRTIIKVIWEHDGKRYFKNNSLSRRPTNTQFFSIILENYQREQKRSRSKNCCDTCEIVKTMKTNMERIEKENAEMRAILNKTQG